MASTAQSGSTLQKPLIETSKSEQTQQRRLPFLALEKLIPEQTEQAANGEGHFIRRQELSAYGLILFALVFAELGLFGYFVIADYPPYAWWLMAIMGIATTVLASELLYCHIDDQGSVLRVNFGLYKSALCGFGYLQIEYRNIKSFGPLTNPPCCRYGVGIKTCGNMRLHSLCSPNCSHKQVVIELKDEMSVCCWSYGKIVISVSQCHYDEFMQMMSSKTDLQNGSVTTI